MSHMADSNDPGPQYGFVEGPPAYQEPADADGAVLASQTKVRGKYPFSPTFGIAEVNVL